MPLFYETPMKRLEHTDFEPHIGTAFTFHRMIEKPSMLASVDNSAATRTEEINAELILTEVQPYELDPRDVRSSGAAGEIRIKPFSVFFECDHEPYLPQGIYDVRHSMFSEPENLFITCLGPNEKNTGYLYQLVFG